MARALEQFVIQNYQRAIQRQEIQTYYQPVIRTASGQLCSFEALARWVDPERGMIWPDEFIPVLEKARVIHELDAAILRQVCARLRSSIHNGETPIPVSVNLSRLDFTLCDIFSVVDQIVSDYQIPHDFVYFEITESVMAEQKDLLRGVVDQFRAAGYQIWMDDFGSAYSSLNVLKEFSFDELKLDMCFLRPFTLRSKRIATAVVEMAKQIDIHTLVEGVETEEQYAYLRDIGCEKVQGYYFGKPLPYDEAMVNLRRQDIRVELPQERKYYDDIGRIDVLSAVPFMTRDEHDAITTARQLNSIPLALAEFNTDWFKVLFCNSAFEETASGTGLFSNVFSQQMLRQPQSWQRISEKIARLMDSVGADGDGRMLFTFQERYYEIQARRMARTKDRCCVLIRITNLTKDTQSEATAQLDEAARRIYALFERVTLVNFPEDSIRPLYMATREDLLSGRRNVKALLAEYAIKYIFPDDRQKYLRLFEPEAALRHLAETGGISISEVFRTNVLHGRYAWKEYTLLRIDEANFFMLVRNVHDSVCGLLNSSRARTAEDGDYAPGQLWNNLVQSDLIRLFWKDQDRRFLGASKAFLDYYGFSSVDEILGRNDEELGWHVHPDLYMNDEYKVIQEGVTLHNMPGICMNNGENREILANKMPLYNVNGEIKGLIGYFIDKELLTANDKRGEDTSRRDLLTGLLNSRGISEEAAAFRDEYYLRGTDFARIHISINDFNIYNEQYGFDFGDRILSTLGAALKRDFGRKSMVGRNSGHEFVVLHQIKNREEAHELRNQIKQASESLQEIDGVPLTLYLSVGYALFSEYLNLDEQAKSSEARLHADYDSKISAESRLGHASELFHLFDELPLSYSVYHVTHAKHSGIDDAVIFYVNHKYEEYDGRKAKQILGHSVRELYPDLPESWFESVKRAALDGETVEGVVENATDGRHYRFTARQILYPGYCAITYQEA